MDGSFADKVVIVTGGAQGIGLCLVHSFAELRAKVVFCDLNMATGVYWQEKFSQQGFDVMFVHTDLSRASDIRRFAARVLKKYGGADVLINNAGILPSGGTFMKRSLEEWNKTISVNLTAQFLCSQVFALALIRSGGCIINIASTRALMSEGDDEPYAASKGGIVALTQSLAISLGEKGVRVNCVSPGWIDTSQWRIRTVDSKLRKIDHRQHPAGRVGKPEDVARICLFLASIDSAGFVTGQNFVVDGGMTKKMIYQ